MPVSSGGSTSSSGTDVFIALDQANYFDRFLFSYSGNLYQLIPGPLDFVTFNPTPVAMWKSVDNGVHWTVLSSFLNVPSGFSTAISPCLIGTKLYFWYLPSATSTLAYFDFTTDTFTSLVTTSSPTFVTSKFLAGPDAAHLFAVDGTSSISLRIAQYLSNVYTAIGTRAPVLPYRNVQPQQMFYGASGVLHILYEANQSVSAVGPSSLGYLNVNGGAISGTIGSTIVYANYGDSFLVPDTGSGLAPGVQFGAKIYYSFYDPTAQQVILLSFDDSASPTFATSVIDSVWPITAGPLVEPGTGSYTSVLAVYNGKLYCFYVNTSITNAGAYTGDSTLYFRSSSDGIVWSARTSIITHKDPLETTPFVIWYPEAVQFVGTLPARITQVALGYNQGKADSLGQYGFNGRFMTNLKLSAPLNYVRD